MHGYRYGYAFSQSVITITFLVFNYSLIKEYPSLSGFILWSLLISFILTSLVILHTSVSIVDEIEKAEKAEQKRKKSNKKKPSKKKKIDKT